MILVGLEFKVQAHCYWQFKSTTSKIHPASGRSGVQVASTSSTAEFKSTSSSEIHPGRSGVACIPNEPKAFSSFKYS
jgi:hypothetical protein